MARLSILSTYIFFIWFYSHKIKDTRSRNLTAGLAVIPFFAILLHYYNDSFEEFENYKGHLPLFLHMPASLLCYCSYGDDKDLENLREFS
jgi:4-hydroxybenzoate polyprenyltransferase